jgi:hypothetical protein
VLWKSKWRNSNKVLNLGENQAEEIMVEEEFKEDFYIESDASQSRG